MTFFEFFQAADAMLSVWWPSRLDIILVSRLKLGMAGENQTNSLSGRSIDVGVVLRALRQSAHLTQQQLGQILGISTRRVGACEHNQTRVMPLIFIRWCRACGHDPAEAMTWLTASESNKVIAQRSDIAIQRKSLFRNQPKTVKTISK